MLQVSSKVSIVIIILLLYYSFPVVPKFHVFWKLSPLCYKLFHRRNWTNDWLNPRNHSLSSETWNHGTIQVNQTLNMELLWNQREPKTELSGPAGCCGLSFPTITRRNWRWLPKVALHIFKFTYCRYLSTKLTITRRPENWL